MMRRRAAGTFDRVLGATGSRWEEEPEGFQLRVWDPPIRASEGRLEVELSRQASRRFGAHPDEELVARISGDRLIVERAKGPRRSRPGDP